MCIRNWHIFVIVHMYMYVTGYIFEINVENFLSKLRCSLSLLTKVCLYEKHWGVLFVFWIVSVTVLYKVYISFPRMIVWRPFLSIHSFVVSSYPLENESNFRFGLNINWLLPLYTQQIVSKFATTVSFINNTLYPLGSICAHARSLGLQLRKKRL